MQLEPRIMFDAAAVATADATVKTEPADSAAKNTADATASEARHEVAFVDPALQNSKQLLSGLDKVIEVVSLQSGQDPLKQISDYLASHNNISALHLFSHGTPGNVTLGNTVLAADTLNEHAQQLESWKQSLTTDADILLYGCDVAAGSKGEAFITQLSILTGADVAASTDPTGAAAKGGDWDLEHSTGIIEATVLNVAGFDALMAAPVNTVPDVQTVAEDNTITFSGTISVADADGGSLTTTISVADGTLTLSQITGLTIDNGSNGSASMRISGTIADINSALNGLIYRPTKDYAGADTLTITTNDGSSTDTDTVGITITANATAPVLTLPIAAQTVAEDTASYLNFTGSNAITLTDADANDLQTLTLTVAHGTLNIKTDVSGSIGATANGTSSVVLSGTAAQLAATLAHANGVQYTSSLNYNSSAGLGAETLSFALSDGVAAHNQSGHVDITVTPNATAPVLTLPAAAQTVMEDVLTYLNFTGVPNAITLTDADAYDLQTLTLSVAHGTLNIKTDVGGGVTSTVGNGTASVILSGTAAQLSATLAHENGVQYTSVLNYNSSYTTAGPETLSFNLNDGVHTQTGTVAMNVTQVNDAPTLTGAGAATVQEGGSVSFNRAQLASSDNALDVDIQTGQQFISQLMVKIVSLPGSGTLTYKSGAVVVGSIVPVSSLGDLKYTHNGTDIVSNATVTFDVTVSDGGGSLPTAGTISIIITPKNVAPTISGSPSLIEGQVKVVAPAINLGDGFDTLANSTIVIDNVVNGSQGTLFIDANNNNVVDAGEALALSGSSTILDAAQRANLATQLKFFQNGYEPNTPLAVSPSYRITVTDAGGGTGVPSAAIAQTITLTILPNNDDPTLVNTNATVGTALGVQEGNVTTITKDMLKISDADLNPANTAQHTPEYQLVYTIGTRPTQGEIQVNIGGGLGYGGTGWITLGVGGRFTQAQVTAEEVRYYQTTNVDLADEPATTDSFTFTVRDSAYGYDVWQVPTDSKYLESPREGGLRAIATGAIANQQFYFDITPLATSTTERTDIDDETADETWTGPPRDATPGYGGEHMEYSFTPTAGMLSNNSTAGGSWDEANVITAGAGNVITAGMLSYTITRTDTKGTEGTGDDVSVTVSANETVYTLTAQPGNGILQSNASGSWQAIPTDGQFTQADINTGKIRFVHDGSENHTSTFDYIVSDGTPNNYPWHFDLDITPTNDRPTGSGGTVQVLEKLLPGNDGLVRLGSSALGMSDVDLSDNVPKRTGEGAADFLWFTIVAQPKDGGATQRGVLQRWDGDSWEIVTTGQWLPSTLLTMTAGVAGDEAVSGLRYAHDGSEPLAYTGSPNVTFQYQVRDDLANPADPLATNVTAVANTSGSAQSNQSANATTTIKIIPVNNAPQIADKPVLGAPDLTIDETIEGGGSTTGKNVQMTIAYEGGDKTITSALLTGIDPDNTTVQRQYIIKTAPTQGILMLSGNLVGVGSTFTQDDIDHGLVTYRHNGSEVSDPTTNSLGTYHDKFHFVLSDAVAEDTGTGASNYNTFLITLTPTNDAPTLTGPTGIILIDSATPANNLVKDGATVFVIADPDLANGVQDGETDFVQATVRLLDSAGNPITDYEHGFDGGGVSIGHATPHDVTGLWKVTQNGTNNILQIQGTREQVNDALVGLSVTFAEDTNLMYKVQVIADDRMRDISGTLTTSGSDANGGNLNQGTTAGAAPVAVPGTVYDWKTAIEVPAADGNIAAAIVDIRASLVNELATFTGPGAQTVYEDVRTQIPANSFEVADLESAAFNTPITVTLTVTSGTLDVAGQGTTQTSFTPSGGQAITISGDRTASITLTGRAKDIQALLNQRNFDNDAADTNGGLFYTSPNNGNHDYNGGSSGDVTLTLSFNDTGSRFGDDVGAGSVANNPANIIIPLTITPVNDVPTVTATSTPIAINGITAVEGFEINDVDYTDGGGILTPETDFVQATIRLLPAAGTTPLTELQHAIVTFGSSSAPLESAVVGSEFEIDDTNTGSGKALVIRGTQAKVNAYLSGLTVALSTVNDNTTYRVQVIADDRLRVLATGALAASNAANGGLNSDGSTGTANVPATAIDPYLAIPDALTDNVASNTRTILGSSLNEAPSFSGLDATPTFVENGAAVVLDANATIGDPELTAYGNWDNAVLTLARNGGANSDDVFGVTGSVDSGINFNGANIRNGTTVVGTFTNNSGTLAITFNSSATNAIVNSVLQAITYSNSNNDPPGDVVTINYTINDGDTDPDRAGNGQGDNGPLAGTGSITVGVTAINDAPTFNTGAAAAFTENAVSPTVIDSLLTITDLDDTQMTGATVSITGNFKTGEDILAVNGTAIGNIISGTAITVASYDGTTGVLTLTGTDTKANYQAALRSVSYTTASDDPTVTTKTTRTITFGVTDANSHGVGAGAQTSTVTRSINITPLADAPVLAGAGQTLLYTENGDAAVIDATVNVASDADDTQMARATITISANRTDGDTLSFTNQNGISGSYTAGTGVMTLTGNATLANYTTALQSIKFRSTSDDPTATSASRTITWQVTDANSDSAGAASSNTVSSFITITPTVDAPTLGGALPNPSYTENGATVALDGNVTVSDVDDTNIVTAIITISNNLTEGDTLNFTNQNGISGSYNAGTGILTLTGNATKDFYQTALRSITFSSTSDDPTVNATKTTRSITWTVTDANSEGLGAQTSSTRTTTLTVVPAKDAPVLAGAGQTLLYTESGDAAVIDATVNVASDIDDTQISGATVTISSGYTTGDTLSYTTQNGITIASNAGGVLTLTGTTTLANYTTALQSVKYSSTSDDPTATSASRTVTWQVTDANSDSAGAASSNNKTSTITITAVNDKPTLSGVLPAPSYTENGSAVVLDANITAGDVDDTNIVSAIITISNNLTEGDTLNFTDQNGITGSYAGGVLTLTGSATLANYTTAMKSVTFSSTSDDPTVNATKTTRSITWTVTDANSEGLGAQTSSTRTTSLTVNPAIDNPVMSAGGTLAYTENQAAAVIDATVNVASDADDTQMAGATITISAGYTAGDTLTFVPQNGITIVSNVGGVLTLTGTTTLANYTTALRSVQYSSTSDDPTATSASRTITWRVTDANSDAAGTGTSAAVTSTINIIVGNEHPVLTPAVGNGAYTENATATLVDNAITVTDADDTNITGGTISITGGFLAGDLLAITNTGAISGSYAAGTGILTLTGTDTLANYQTVLRSLTYLNNTEDPTSNASKPTRTITYSLTDANSDGVGAATGTVTKTINVTALTDNPVMSSGGTLAYTENQAAQVIDGGVSVVSDADDTDIAGATITISAGYTAGDTLTFVPQNGITIVSNVGGVLTLTGTTTRAQYTAALQSIKFHSTSEDPTATSTSRTVTWRVTDANSDAAGAGTSDAVTSTINIAAVNDAPVAVADTGTTPENVTLTVAAGSGVLVNDTDVDTSDTHTVSEVNGVPGNVATGVTGSNGGTFTIAADGSYVFNPGTAFNDLFVGESRTTSVTYTNLDSNGLSASSTLTITVTGINAVPVPAPPPPDLPGAPPLGPPPPTADPPAVIIPGYYSFNDPASTLLGSLSQYGDNGDGAGGGIGGGDATDNIYGYDLYLVKTPSSQEMLVDEVGSFNLPTGTFRHSSGNAKISLEASLADGSPLPEWLTFDPDSGRFTGKPPKGTGGAMDIKILARDDRGNVAFAQFLLHITEQESNDAQTIKERQTDSNAEGIDSYHLKPTDNDKDKPQQPKRRYAALGRSSLSDQFKQQQLRGRNEALLETLQRTTVRLQ
jgi:hypothetical protein